jgi:peptide/nickel transport system ATP-binding protein
MPSTHAIAKFENLEVRFSTPDGEIAAVKNFSLSIARGECVGVVGESGAGKSQAFLAVMGLLASNGRVTGTALFDEVDPKSVLGARIGMVFQDPMTSLTPHLTIGDQIAEPIVTHRKITWREARERALALLQKVHVTDAPRRMKQYPHELSGGMRQRVMIAIALACDPELLIADEPTTALDVTIQAQILALLAELKRDGMAMVLITHDFGVIAGLADRVAVMREGKILELDDVRSVLKAPKHPYTQQLLQAMPPMDGPFPPPASSQTVLTVSHLSVQFGELRALDDVSLEIKQGEALGIVGESGSGKSTLARAVMGLVHPGKGDVVWKGQALQKAFPRALRREVQMVFQDPLASLDPRMTIGEIVEEPLRVHGGDRARVAEVLVRVGLSPDLMNRYPHEFSGGQCQRVGIARAMILNPKLLVCDEPVSALDVSIQEQIVTLLADLKREYDMSILFVSHNLAVVRRLCERVLVLYLGRMMELAPSDRLYEHPLHPYTRSLLEAVPVPDPDVQPARLKGVLNGEAPSPLDPPSGCVYRTRCPHAVQICGERVPEWEEAAGGHLVACHRWREVG